MIPHATGGVTWPSFIVQMCIELLSHRLPPSCIAPSILTIASYLLPEQDIVQKLPTTRWVRQLRTVLTGVTKTLAAFTLALVEFYCQLFTDGTS